MSSRSTGTRLGNACFCRAKAFEDQYPGSISLKYLFWSGINGKDYPVAWNFDSVLIRGVIISQDENGLYPSLCTGRFFS